MFTRQILTLAAIMTTAALAAALPSPEPQGGGFIGVTKCAGHVGKYACYNDATIVLCTSDDQGTPVSYCGSGQKCSMISGLPYCV